MKGKTIETLTELRTCKEAVEWLKGEPNSSQAWADCERGDWMLWLLGKLSGKPGKAKRKKLVLCACECARLALEYVRKGEKRPRKAIETAEAWARGEGPSLEDVQAAASAAFAASVADAAFAASAADAAYAAFAAAFAASAASAAFAASAASAAYAARINAHRHCADIVRKHYPTAPRLK